MSPEETFFKEARIPVRLAAAAYSGEDDFQKLTFIAHGNQVQPVSKKLKPYLTPSDRWKENIVVHVAVIPVKLRSNRLELGSDPKERHKEEEEEDGEELCWDLALVYRGTEPFSVKNWITDLTFEQEPVGDYVLRHPDPKQQDKLLVHRGFHQAFKSIHPDPQQSSEIQEGYVSRINSAVSEVKLQIRSNLERRIADDATMSRQQQSRSTLQRLCSKLATCLDHPSPRRVLCIGHSLGGALATLAAAWCKTTLCGDSAFRDSQVHCITVGSPRVGNRAFAQAWNELLLDNTGAANPRLSTSLCYRIVNALDPIPSMPPARMLGYNYQHVGRPVYLERRVENWTIAVIAHLDKERPWENCLSLLDHFQWNYTAALDAAEVSSQQRGASGDSGKKELHGWLYWLSQQLKPAALWNLFREILGVDISIKAHFWMLLFSWGLGIALLALTYAMRFGMVFIIRFLLPALTIGFAHDCVIRALRLHTYHTGYRIGNLSLALLSVLVMVMSYVAVWFGL